jgi:hypothetical protein
LGALIPQKRGPRRAHKLSQKIVAFIERTIAADPEADLVAAVQQEFGISVHRRSIERALTRAKKNDSSDRARCRWPWRSYERPRAGHAL